MEEYVRKELEEICQDILNNTQATDIEQQLASVQSLYEKLLVLNYVSSRKQSVPQVTAQEAPKPEPKVEAPAPPPVQEIPKPEPPKPVVEEKPEIVEPIAEAPKSVAPPQPVQQKPEPINESPVIEKELVDDKTPQQQQMEEVLRQSSAPKTPSKSSSINERYGTGAITLGLNDRIAFVNQLFGGQQEDLNRVISQINTLESFQEAEDFIENMIKPEYDWSQKEEFEMRFMDRVRQKFGE
ncbi:hypothetical protein Oweho_1956 [Owenweeksia hongkongensis DSM 17368]|uniref:Uncharacterized protein n=1 Tax=Owenweeksia hongkongensis (strain DSM 17368 / CIP 108786 / JCM 12287 / NRRL B-23963 / UST20020801) TaxID=926562 RepID=G8R2E5_OWEHD|nr:hypothetical protein [Owenweeksia hongkongensis]AEV32935.1 hypothetical protein Oweho_1956 [Owenweeksia hongkongensis DSM 17368]